MSIETKLDRIDKKLTTLLSDNRKPAKWVKVSIIKRLTKWDRRDLYRARENNLVRMERRADGIFYDLNSLAKEFIKH